LGKWISFGWMQKPGTHGVVPYVSNSHSCRRVGCSVTLQDFRVSPVAYLGYWAPKGLIPEMNKYANDPVALAEYAKSQGLAEINVSPKAKAQPLRRHRIVTTTGQRKPCLV